MSVSLVVACAKNGVIGVDNKLPWHLPADLKFFKNLTTGNTILMGRKTHESIGKALPNRVNIVITRNPFYKSEGCVVVHDLHSAVSSPEIDGEVFVIGGAEIYRLALAEGIVDRIYRTVVDAEFEGDAVFEFEEDAWTLSDSKSFESDEKNKWPYRFDVLDPIEKSNGK